MLIFYYHLCWFSCLVSLSLGSAVAAFLLVATKTSALLLIPVFSLNGVIFPCSFYLDSMSSSFMVVVCLISSCIMIYSFNYINPYSNAPVFLWMTFLFVVSILLVVTMSNLFYIMLGWDGLGLVSFFLIVFYQNQSSITSGIFTLLINRLGDCFFLLSLGVLFTSSSSSGSIFTPAGSAPLLSYLLVSTFMTNSALFPFSPWLPLAIAAPTPISALVHSSTLVTSGLFLIMRYSSYILSDSFLAFLLLTVSVFTSLYAGLNSLFESDLKNLIALSTLSHLGFIGLALSSGALSLSFFHLIAHALFKSLLFIAMGDIITNLSHSQDIRYLSHGSILTPFSSLVMSVSLLNLLGLPSLSGFFSKDLILESLNYSHTSTLLLLVVAVNVFLTFFYTLQLLFFTFQPVNVSPYSPLHFTSPMHTAVLTLLGCFSVLFGCIQVNGLDSCLLFPLIPSLQKSFPLLACAAILAVLYLGGSFPSSASVALWVYFSSIINLFLVAQPLTSAFSLGTGILTLNSTESGLFSASLNSLSYTTVLSVTNVSLSLLSLNPIGLVLLIGFSLTVLLGLF